MVTALGETLGYPLFLIFPPQLNLSVKRIILGNTMPMTSKKVTTTLLEPEQLSSLTLLPAKSFLKVVGKMYHFTTSINTSEVLK